MATGREELHGASEVRHATAVALFGVLMWILAIAHPDWYLVFAYAVGIPAVIYAWWWMHTWRFDR